MIYTHGPDNNRLELYNLKTDPQELVNLVDIEKDKFRILKSELEKWMIRPKPNIIPLRKQLGEQGKEGI